MIDAVVVAYRSRDVIGACVSELARCRLVDRVIVVNNSAETLADVLAGIPKVELRVSARNLGFGPGINTIRSQTQAPYILIANPDTRPRPGAIEQLCEILERDRKIGLVGPRLQSEDGVLQRTSQAHLTLFRMIGERFGFPWPVGLEHTIRRHQSRHRTAVLIGAFLLASREALEAADWFDESIFLLGEDQDLSRRIAAAGYGLVYEPSAVVIHERSHARRQEDSDSRLLQEARARELLRNGRPREARLYRKLKRIEQNSSGA